MNQLVIKWEYLNNDPLEIKYYINNSPVGTDDNGFEKILDMLINKPEAKVTLKVKVSLTMGSGSLASTLPFKDRMDDFKKALGTRTYNYDSV